MASDEYRKIWSFKTIFAYQKYEKYQNIATNVDFCSEYSLITNNILLPYV